MASVTLQVAQTFPAGTSVQALKRSNYPSVPDMPTGGAVGSPDATVAVASDGTLTFTGLTDNTLYVAYASVSSVDRYIQFRTASSSSGAGPVSDVDVASMPADATELPAAAALADATANPTIPSVGAFPHGYNGTTFDRLRTASVLDASSRSGILAVLSAFYRESDGNVGMQRGASADGTLAVGVGSVAGLLYNGATYDLPRAANAANQAAATKTGVAQIARVGNWSVTSAPAAGTVASAVKSAGAAGVRHIITGFKFEATAAGGAAPATTTVTVTIRDGASGAGTILETFNVRFNAQADGTTIARHSVTGLSLVGTAATAATVEFSAGATNVLESVAINGYSVA